MPGQSTDQRPQIEKDSSKFSDPLVFNNKEQYLFESMKFGPRTWSQPAPTKSLVDQDFFVVETQSTKEQALPQEKLPLRQHYIPPQQNATEIHATRQRFAVPLFDFISLNYGK